MATHAGSGGGFRESGSWPRSAWTRSRAVGSRTGRARTGYRGRMTLLGFFIRCQFESFFRSQGFEGDGDGSPYDRVSGRSQRTATGLLPRPWWIDSVSKQYHQLYLLSPSTLGADRAWKTQMGSSCRCSTCLVLWFRRADWLRDLLSTLVLFRASITCTPRPGEHGGACQDGTDGQRSTNIKTPICDCSFSGSDGLADR